MKTETLAEVRNNLSPVLDRLGQEPLSIERRRAGRCPPLRRGALL